MKVEYKQDMPFVTFNFIPRFWSSDKGSCFVGMGKRIANCMLELQKNAKRIIDIKDPLDSLEPIDYCNKRISSCILKTFAVSLFEEDEKISVHFLPAK